jgi:transposase-like protein
MEGESTGNSRRKSYTAKFKLKVVEVAKEKGNREAGRLFNVGESSVREWRKS